MLRTTPKSTTLTYSRRTVGTTKRQRQRANRAARQARTKRRKRIGAVRKRTITIVVIVAVAVAAGLLTSFLTGGGDDELISGEYARFRNQPTACGAEAPEPVTEMEFEQPQDQGLDPERLITAIITTSCGDITIELDPGAAPETVNSFVFLAREGFYDGVVFHRILDGFVAQAGDPTAVGTGGPGYRLPDEFPPDDFVYEQGTVAMANSGRSGTSGSQFFIALGERAAALAPRFTVIGRTTDSEDTLQRIGEVPVTFGPGGEESFPRESVYIESVEIQVAEE